VSDYPANANSTDWHRYFAVTGNNRAWTLSVQSRTPEEDLEMLDAAHLSAWHWQQIGTPLQHMRATMLLAQVHALLGHGALAFSLATRMREYFLGRDTPDWELAFTHAIHAHAAWADGRETTFSESWRAAEKAIASITDSEDRRLVLETFRQVPVPD